LNDESIIQGPVVDNAIPRVNYSFVPIDSIQQLAKDDIVDVIGVVTNVGDANTILTRAGKEMIKRNITLLDSTANSIEMTLWGNTATNFQAADFPILAVKGANVSDYNNRTLNSITSTQFEFNPDRDEAFSLREWFDNQQGGEIPTYSLSRGGAGSGNFKETARKTLSQVREEQIGQTDTGYWAARATITMIKKEPTFAYLSCPSEKCKKKVTEMNGYYQCLACNKDYEQCTVRYILNFSAADHTSALRLNAFHEAGLIIMEVPAEDVMGAKDEQPTIFENYFYEATFKRFNFKCRSKWESYNETGSVKHSIMSAIPIDFVTESRVLLNEIQKLEVM